eukprot:CAMPEP_0113542026 /NCGR_PEP_ID=MMETSP0015_2-20120614/9371_1 /TAXON_ID=2838 /ORGANISM="Odontella" /LENGTH=777 /DNA_ID=CAMNT_0000442023 /DNA_START=73 /DNA_END=2403 /DNA_ORIENTATION=- /assembly_acc=CAM_ASM_000160
MPRSQGTSRKGKPKKGERAAGMGRALERSQKRRHRPKPNGSSPAGGGMAASGATSIGMDGDDAHKKTMSVLEVNDLTDFLSQSEMAGREFTSEKEQFVVLDDVSSEYKPLGERESAVRWEDRREEDEERRRQRETFRFRELSVPRRPAWDSSTTPEELDRREREYFVEWRRGIALREEELYTANKGSTGGFAATVTPFEKNLEVWRQLWRVLERSDAVVQIVDARNPLFYLNADLRTYAEVDLGKPMLIVVNKSDYLTDRQRMAWHEYLEGRGYEHVFFSAYSEQEKLDEKAREERRKLEDGVEDPRLVEESAPPNEHPAANAGFESNDCLGVDFPLTRSQLMDALVSFAKRRNVTPSPRNGGKYQFGMVGFPNVGKSSVINVLIGSSKHSHGLVRVGVASQPGKTKHFQTLALPDRADVGLCDCPGLVFPSFVSGTADLIAAGVFPIAQMRDHWSVVELICRRIPREVLNARYGISLPIPTKQDLRERGLADWDDDATGRGERTKLPPPTAEELLGTYCVARSIMGAASGVPDYQQAARIVVRDYVEGKLLYNHAPPPPDSADGSRLDEGDDDLPAVREEEDEGEEDDAKEGDAAATAAPAPVGGGTTALMDEAEFRRETLKTALLGASKLRERLAAAAALEEEEKEREGKNSGEKSPGADGDGGDLDLLDDDGIDILDAVGGFAEDGTSGEVGGGKRGKSHKSVKKWGKKGRKLRNKDPYGCHGEPDAELMEMSSGGVCVNAGKYGGTGYTRASHSGARAAMAPTEGEGGKKSRR